MFIIPTHISTHIFPSVWGEFQAELVNILVPQFVLVTDEPVEIEKWPGRVQELRKLLILFEESMEHTSI